MKKQAYPAYLNTSTSIELSRSQLHCFQSRPTGISAVVEKLSAKMLTAKSSGD